MTTAAGPAPSWEELAQGFEDLSKVAFHLKATWFAYAARENKGIWCLEPREEDTAQVREKFSMLCTKAVRKLRIPPEPIPLPEEHSPCWKEEARFHEVNEAGEEDECHTVVPYGLGYEDVDAVDPYTRAWLEHLRKSEIGYASNRIGEEVVAGRALPTLRGEIKDVLKSSVILCLRTARSELSAQTISSGVVEAGQRFGGERLEPGGEHAAKYGQGSEWLGQETEASCPDDPTESQMIAALSARPRTESFPEWFEKRRSWLEKMAEKSKPSYHRIEEAEVNKMAVKSALRMFDARADELYPKRPASLEAWREQLNLPRKEAHEEVMTTWRAASETLRKWGEENVQPTITLYLEEHVFKWEHRAIRAGIVQAAVRDAGARLGEILVRLKQLADEEARGNRTTRVLVWESGYDFESVGSGLFQETVVAVMRDLGTLMGAQTMPVQYCLWELLRELICELDPIDDPDVSRLSKDQVWGYLFAPHSGNTRIPDIGQITDLCGALQWYGLRLRGVCPVPLNLATPVRLKTKRESGRIADKEQNWRIAEILARLGDWRQDLDTAAKKLDKAKIKLPPSPKRRKLGCTDWSEFLIFDREGFTKALVHRVNWAARNPESS